MLSRSRPAVGWTCPPVPASNSTRSRPVETTSGVNGIGTNSSVWPAAFSAAFTSSRLAFLKNAGSCGFSQMPS